ncbi:MAG: SAM-dependent chlorinase/fluorinase [Desulfofustis sp.]|nr:SAM-dependent chlorinase/fluorinase [Desulfofustis sp.]NNK55946.1 SAM-dependent chlorinase/fluorinase [Desulfofustis sp.]
MKGSPIILTTDFGLSDEYVGVLKGVILSINPHATIIDLSHGIPPQATGRAAEVLCKNYRYFPAGSIHVCVVDPGVGTERRIVVVRGCNQFFIGPDNGVFSRILETDQAAEVYELTNSDWFLEDISTTFHGRDIMAPAAARLSLGASINEVGPLISTDSCVTTTTTPPLVSETGIRGEISAIDRFGNLITNIEEGILIDFGLSPRFAIRIKSQLLQLHQGSYGHLPDNQPAAIINSSSMLEICVKNGNAAAILEVGIGERVVVKTK